MNLKELKELIVLMNEHQLVEIELEREGTKIRLRKGGAMEISGMLPEQIHLARSAFQEGPAPAPTEVPKPAGLEIKSPMVGTFYRASSPEAPPFVETGQEIEPGQVLCIVEAMKLMNEIKSEVRGRILQILVENGQPVQFGQSLFLVEPA